MGRKLIGLLLAALIILIASSPCAAEEVWAEVADGTVTVYHLAVEYNCCWILAADVQVSGGFIDLYEQRAPESEDCICMCTFDLRFAFPAPPPGSYTLRVWYAVYPGEDPPLAAELPLEIPAVGAGPLIVDQSDCGGWATGVPDPPLPAVPTSFSAIRALY